MTLGSPRLHFRRIPSTNDQARRLAAAGAPHGTVVTAAEQTAGRGRQGRSWSAPPGSGLLCSVLVRDPPRMLPLYAGVALTEMVEEVVGRSVAIKWPNDVLLDARKLAGILVEGRPQEGWAVVGIGLNVAVRLDELPQELRARAATLGLGPDRIGALLDRLLTGLGAWLAVSPQQVLEVVRARDALLGREVRWSGGEGRGAGIDDGGRLLVETAEGTVALDAGEVHLDGDPAMR